MFKNIFFILYFILLNSYVFGADESDIAGIKSNEVQTRIPNQPYVPSWFNIKDMGLIAFVFKDVNPKSFDPDTYSSQRSWYFYKNSKNPNKFKFFSSDNLDLFFKLDEIEKAFGKEIEHTEIAINRHDDYYNDLIIKKIMDLENELRSSNYGDFYKRIQKEKLNNLRLELNSMESREKNKKDLEEKLKRLEELKVEMTDLSNGQYEVILRKPTPVIVNVPGWREAYRDHKLNKGWIKEANQNDSYNQGVNQKIIVIDQFERKRGSESTLANKRIESNLSPIVSKKGYYCFDSHSCHVTGIIVDMAPKVEIIPYVFTQGLKGQQTIKKAVVKIMKNDHGAKVINMSLDFGDKDVLLNLCKNHIVVIAAGNDGDSYPSYLLEALEDENVRKHLIVVVNIMSDGKNISPTSRLPANSIIAQNATVAAPGTWIVSTAPNLLDEELDDVEDRRQLLKSASWEEITGTSQAAPVVTGLVARLLSNFPNLSLDEIVSVIKESADKSGPLADKTLFGNGLIDFSNAYQIAVERENQK